MEIKSHRPCSQNKTTAVRHWAQEQQEVFDKFNILLTYAPILKQRRGNKSCLLKADVSGYALGAILLHGKSSVEIASRLL